MSALFGAKLRKLREEHGLIQAVLGRRFGLASHAHIANVELGHDRPSLDLVVRIATLFRVTVDELVRDTVPIEAVRSPGLCDTGPSRVDPVQLGQQVRTLRQSRGLTQAVLAQRLESAGQSGIGKIERGEKLPSLERLVQLADALGVSTDDLLVASSQ